MIAIVDYGMGNLGSIQNMLRHVGAAATITSDPAAVEAAPKLLLPGVGSFDRAMEAIDGSGLREVLDRRVLEDRVPVLGICLGMQLLAKSSEEGSRPGLGWIPATVRRFPRDNGLKVPHMGWNVARPTRSSPLTTDLPEDSRFYFVHSYYVKADDPNDPVLQTTYGVTFDAAVERGNILGAQFHPEKSHRFGKQLLKNFALLPEAAL